MLTIYPNSGDAVRTSASQELPSGVTDAGRRAQLNADEAGEDVDVDRIREGEGNLVDVGDAVGAIDRRARRRGGGQRG